MAFNKSASSNVAPFAGRNAGQNEQWKADAFLNLYMPTKNGRRKVGYIPLKGNRAFDAAIIERLQQGGEEALKAFREVVEIEFHTAEAEEDNLPVF